MDKEEALYHLSDFKRCGSREVSAGATGSAIDRTRARRTEKADPGGIADGNERDQQESQSSR